MNFTKGSVNYHRSRAKIEMMRASQAVSERAGQAHYALARIHLARSELISNVLNGRAAGLLPQNREANG